MSTIPGDDLPPIALPAAFWDQYDRRLRARLAGAPPRGLLARAALWWHRRLSVPAPLAAGAALALLLLAASHVVPGGRSHRPPALPTPSESKDAPDRVLIDDVDASVIVPSSYL